MLTRFVRMMVVVSVGAALLASAAVAEARGAAVEGNVSAGNGTPRPDAVVTLSSQTASAFAARIEPNGHFRFGDVAEGTYVLTVRAATFVPVTRRITVNDGSVTQLDIVLAPLTTSSIQTIGTVRVNGAQSASNAAAPATIIPTRELGAQSISRLSDVFGDELSTVLTRPAGGGATAPVLASLRSSDPSETVIDVDGHQINTGSSGAFDLSLIDPADFANIELVYGIAPSSLVGPNTIGGAVNLRTLEPTKDRHGLLRIAAGSHNTLGATLQATGTARRLGYALSVHRVTSDGEVHGAGIGSAVLSKSVLTKVRYDVGHAGGFAQLTVRDSTVGKDESAALTEIGPAPAGSINTTNFAGSRVEAHNATYGLEVSLPLGPPDRNGTVASTVVLRHFAALAAQSVLGPAADTSSSFVNDRDVVGEGSVELTRVLSRGVLSVKYSARGETLRSATAARGVEAQSTRRRVQAVSTDAPSVVDLKQAQHSFALRYALDPTPQMHYTAALYQSTYSVFGSSFDPRIGLVWTPTPQTAVRVSAGTTFQSPQLTSLFVPSPLPPVTANGPRGVVEIGNPDLKADRATEYGLGIEHVFDRRRGTRVSLDLYRTNLRSPAQAFIPETRPAYSYPVNIGNAVYEGAELRAQHSFGDGVDMRAGYGVSAAYPTRVPSQIGGDAFVAGQQFQGVPLHRAMVQIERVRGAGLHFALGAAYASANNELNRPAYVSLRARTALQFGATEIALSATNITNVYADRFTLTGRGVPYAGADGPIPTDAYSLPARALTLSLTRRY